MRHLADPRGPYLPPTIQRQSPGYLDPPTCITIPGTAEVRRAHAADAAVLDYSVIRVRLFRNSILLDLPAEPSLPES